MSPLAVPVLCIVHTRYLTNFVIRAAYIHVPFSFVFVLSSCRFPFDSCIAFVAFTFASLRSRVADSAILLFRLGATCTHPPRSLRAWSMRIPLACCLLSFLRCWCWLILRSIYFFLGNWQNRVYPGGFWTKSGTFFFTTGRAYATCQLCVGSSVLGWGDISCWL